MWLRIGFTEAVHVYPNDSVMSVLSRVFRRNSWEKCGLVVMICWGLWSRRNNWVWNHVNTSNFGVQSRAYSMLAEWSRAKEAQVMRLQRHQVSNSCKPPEGWMKINSDAACHLQTGKTGVACIIRDDQGRFIRARSTLVQGRAQTREIEAMGLREALSWTKEWRTHKCIFECDAKQVVEAIHARGKILL